MEGILEQSQCIAILDEGSDGGSIFLESALYGEENGMKGCGLQPSCKSPFWLCERRVQLM